MTGFRDSIDLLHKFSSGNGSNRFPARIKSETEPVEKVELSLGLSLNGRFGSMGKDNNNNNNNNKKKKKKLSRASSVTDFVNFPVDVELSLCGSITRTCSLPPETEVEWRKRKELQTLRRSEAKRKRVEKLKNGVIVKGKTEEGLKQSPPSPSRYVLLPPATPVRFSSQGSVGSQESGGSSGVSDLDSQPLSGTNGETSETNDRSELNKFKCNPKTKAQKQRAYNETMPCVSTKGDGPDGKRIQGFLYRYGKGEEVRIVCVCHGSFLTPAEFVKHGGGGDVDHPLRHIVVTSLCS